MSEERKPVSSLEVFGWPECKAFLTRLGVDESDPIRRLRITLDLQDVALIESEYCGSDTKSESRISRDFKYHVSN